MRGRVVYLDYVRELRRQIATQLYERCSMSLNPSKLIAAVQNNNPQPADIIKHPFIFEFLGLKAKDTVEETDLEQALIDHLQEFLLELGYGFCFEARQDFQRFYDRDTGRSIWMTTATTLPTSSSTTASSIATSS